MGKEALPAVLAWPAPTLLVFQGAEQRGRGARRHPATHGATQRPLSRGLTFGAMHCSKLARLHTIRLLGRERLPWYCDYTLIPQGKRP